MNQIADDKEQAVLVHIDFHTGEFEDDHNEFVQLVESANLKPEAVIQGSRQTPDPKYFVGQGKAEEIAMQCQALDIKLIIFNHSLSPSQERNLEKLCKARVIDRVGLILDIFAQRASSYEGKLQVELAQLTHLSTRLIRGWTHLERQKGGIGLRGPGETQLETDRRLLRQRIKTIKARLEKVKQQRQQGRQRRLRSKVPLVALVGYTNAGKSTLFNTLTDAKVYAADQLFATLDATQRRCVLEGNHPIVLSDTVGFIRQIPHDLIESFHATLLEVKQADLLLHVVDVNDPQRQNHIDQVNEVIDEIEAGDVPQLMVYNKIDLDDAFSAKIRENEAGVATHIWLSAKTREGQELLKDAINSFVYEKNAFHQLHIPPSAGKLRAQLFNAGVVEQETTDEKGGWVMDIHLDKTTLELFCKQSGVSTAVLQGELIN